MAGVTVRPLPVMDQAVWTFRDSRPSWRHRRHGAVAFFDPFPAYPHRIADVEAAAAHVAACCPPLWDVDLYVADREEEGRSNAYAGVCEDGRYQDGRWVKDPPVGLIVLCGKRVPPHPAVTGYLVAHEYGHNVEYMLQHLRHPDSGLPGDDLVRDYATVRGLPDEAVHHGSGGRWHDSATEILACDFRILVCGVETGYWPHPGVPEPGDVDGLGGWWADAVAAITDARTKVVAPP